MGCNFFFFFKQKTAYEITRRDWSSDVCSSDLGSRSSDRIKSSTDSHGSAQRVARNGTDLFQRLASLDHFRERPLVRRKINPQFRAFQLPAAAVLHQFA